MHPQLSALKNIDLFGSLSDEAARQIISTLLYGGRYIVMNQENITSSSSVTAGTGAKTWTIPTGLPLQPTEYVYMCKNEAPYYWLGGTITSYDTETGELVLDISTNGLGCEEISDWFLVAGGPAFGVFQYQGSVKGPSMGIYAQIASNRRDPFNHPILIYSNGGLTPVLVGMGDGSVGFGTEAPMSRIHVVGATGATPGAPDTGIRVTKDLANNRGVVFYPDTDINRMVSYDWDNGVYYPMSWEAFSHIFIGPIIGNPKFTAGSTHMGSSGGLARCQSEATIALSGAVSYALVGLPENSRLIGVQLRVDEEITSDTGTSFSAAYITGSSAVIATGQSFAKNTKVNKVHTDEITTGTTQVAITPNEGVFTGGVIRAIVYYETLLAMEDAP